MSDIQLFVMSEIQIYQTICPYFKLLYIYDIEDISKSKLKELINDLQKGQDSKPTIRQIYNKLEEASKRNIANKLKKKKQSKISSNISNNNSNIQQSFRQMSILDLSQNDTNKRSHQESAFEQSNYSVNQSVFLDQPIQEYQTLAIKNGKIFGGQLLTTFTLSDLIKSKSIQTEFYIDSKKHQSTISKQTLAQLNLKSQNPSLLVDNRKQKFRVSTRNILSLSYLQNNKVIIQCNYRSQASSFQMIYTQ